MGFGVTIMAMTVVPVAIMTITVTVTMRMNMVQAMFHPMNHTTRTEEQQRLEKGVGNQVEESSDIGTCAQRRNHKAQLADGRIGQHPFDVPLRHRNRRCEDGRKRTDKGDKGHRAWRCFPHHVEEWEHAHNQEDTSRNHRRRMNHGANGRWPFHRVRQPNMQGELCALTNRTKEDQDADYSNPGQRLVNQRYRDDLFSQVM